MDELIARLTDAVGVDAETARKAVSIILGFLREQGPTEKVDELIGKIGGAGAAIEETSSGGGFAGGLVGMMGGGAMVVLGKLQAAGLGMGEIQGVTKETVAFAREKGGEDLVDEIIGSIPGLGQFI
jgi:hypothetical protein